MIEINEKTAKDFIKTKDVYTTCKLCDYAKNGTKEEACLYCGEYIDTEQAKKDLILIRLDEYLKGCKRVSKIDYDIISCDNYSMVFKTSKLLTNMINSIKYMGFSKVKVTPINFTYIRVLAWKDKNDLP